MMNAIDMVLSTIIGLLFSVLTFSTLVTGDSLMVLTIGKTNIIQKDSDYFGPVEIEVTKGKKSSQFTLVTPVKKELPDTMQLKVIVTMEGEDPLEKTWDLCDCLDDLLIGKSIIDAGLPKDTFPKACPVGVGEFTVFKYDPPMHLIPPGSLSSRFSSSAMLLEEGKEPYVQIDMEGELSQGLPGFGR